MHHSAQRENFRLLVMSLASSLSPKREEESMRGGPAYKVEREVRPSLGTHIKKNTRRKKKLCRTLPGRREAPNTGGGVLRVWRGTRYRGKPSGEGTSFRKKKNPSPLPAKSRRAESKKEEKTFTGRGVGSTAREAGVLFGGPEPTGQNHVDFSSSNHTEISREGGQTVQQ